MAAGDHLDAIEPEDQEMSINIQKWEKIVAELCTAASDNEVKEYF